MARRAWSSTSRSQVGGQVASLVGHSLGLRGISLDPDALPLREAVALIPALGQKAEVRRREKDVRFEGLDLRDRRPIREITLDDPRPGRRERLCPSRVPSREDVVGNVFYLDAFRKRIGGGGSHARRAGW